MVIDNYFKPDPHDFGEYVYCGVKWAFKKGSSSDKKLINKNKNLSLGQQNEHKCINWVLNKKNVTKKQILFDGTGKNNYNFLTSEIKSVSISMHCKPDLIITKDNQNLLFEFKAVSNPSYLSLPEFDSDHAQVWCYSNLNEIQIDEYYLLRYFIDPCSKFPLTFDSRSPSSASKYKKLTPYELDPTKFEKLFVKYIKAIEFFNDPVTKKRVLTEFGAQKSKELVSYLLSPPIETKKCTNCTHRRRSRCELYTHLRY